ncbi:MAG: sugar phosphate isomerase/epimerase [Thermoguttaceae bacterium]|jgi:sugar phosphate isomerase/epimerase|nr:sugar phosphate isomerase/epimerase [Thermoguttaceae bacterium]
MTVSRRDLLKFGVGAAALWTVGEPCAVQAKEQKKIPIGLQVYSVREIAAKNLARVLRAIGEMGYQGVEFAGYYNHTAEAIRKMLDDSGLKCCGTHIGLDTLLGDQFAKTVEFNKVLGNPYLIVSWMPESRLSSLEVIRKTAALYTELAAKAKAHGMKVGYHAHGGDFKKVGDQTAWELFFTHAGPDVVMQMDIGNCIGGGGDPYAILRKFPGRSATVHLKEHGGKPGAPVGEGEVRWKEIFEICETTGGTQWYIVEQESYAGPPLESVKACLQNLRKMGK